MVRKPDTPEYSLTAREVAEVMGISFHTVRKDLVKRGCPALRRGNQPALFNLATYRAWRERNGLTGRTGRPKAESTVEMDEAKLRKEVALADKYELQVDRLRSQLINITDHERVCRSLTTTATRRLRRLPSEVGPVLVGLEGAAIEDALDLAVRGVCEHLSNPASYHIAPMGGAA